MGLFFFFPFSVMATTHCGRHMVPRWEKCKELSVITQCLFTKPGKKQILGPEPTVECQHVVCISPWSVFWPVPFKWDGAPLLERNSHTRTSGTCFGEAASFYQLTVYLLLSARFFPSLLQGLMGEPPLEEECWDPHGPSRTCLVRRVYLKRCKLKMPLLTLSFKDGRKL